MIKNVRLVLRKANLVDIAIPNRSGVASYQIHVANTLNGAFDLVPGTTGLVNIFNVNSLQEFRSPSLKNNKRERQQGSNRGITRVLFDPMDYYDPTTTTPTDDQQMYLRVAEVDAGANVIGYSPILVIPPPEFFYFPRGTITLVGNVPNLGKSAGDWSDVTDMSIIVPKYANYVNISRTSGNLLFAPSEGMPFIQINSTNRDDLTVFGSSNKQFIFSGGGGAAGFQVFLSVLHES